MLPKYHYYIFLSIMKFSELGKKSPSIKAQ